MLDTYKQQHEISSEILYKKRQNDTLQFCLYEGEQKRTQNIVTEIMVIFKSVVRCDLQIARRHDHIQYFDLSEQLYSW